MAEIPEIPVVPAEAPPAEAAAPHPDPSGESLGGAQPAEATNQSGWVDSGSPAVVGSYATPAPSAAAEAPAPEAAPAVFVAGYGSAPADLLQDQPAPEAAPAVFVAGYGSAPSESVPTDEGASPSDTTAAPATTAGNAPGAEPAAVSRALESEATPAPSVEAFSQQPEPPGIATSIVVPPLPAGEAGDGGEWDLLRSKVSTWFDGADLQGRWESLGGPLRAAGLLLAAVVLLRLYSALLETLGDLPLVPRLLQLVGLLSVARFALAKLVRSSERERILTSWNQRWNDFRGRD